MTDATIHDRDRGVFPISVAAELARMHPQTLRIYEAKGLIKPARSPGGTRRYSYTDVERLQRIQQMTELGMNLAAVERVFGLEDELAEMSERMQMLEQRAHELHEQMNHEIEMVRRQFRAEIVPYEPPVLTLVPVRRSSPQGHRTTITYFSSRSDKDAS